MHVVTHMCTLITVCFVMDIAKIEQETHHVNSRKALRESTIVDGIKGPSWLMKLTYYDIIRGTSIDYMHCVLLGVMKLLMSLWFNTTYNHERCYLGRKVGDINPLLEDHVDQSILNITKSQSTDPFYCIILCRCYMIFCHRSTGIITHPLQYLLMQQSISDEQLKYCEQTIKQSCCQFERLYHR